MRDKPDITIGRRSLLLSAGGIAALPLVGSSAAARAPAPGRATGPDAGVVGRRKLGRLEVSSIGLGVQNNSRKYTTEKPYRPEQVALIRTAFDHGVTFFDCAEAYGPHECERILGEAIQPFREQVVITSKFGWNIDQETGRRMPGLNSRPDHVRLVVDNMLRRLRTDHIDLLYQHRVDPAVPIEDVAGVVEDLMRQGKVRHWGLSEMGLGTLRRAHAALPVTAVQSEYSMLWRGPEHEVLALCEELGIGFVPWSPLGVQFLTGWIDANTRFAQGDIRAVEGRFAPENLPGNLRLVSLLQAWAERKQAAPGQIALAWLMAQKPWIVPIPGTTNPAHLVQNIGSTAIRFSADEIAELNADVRAIEVVGQRLPDAVLAYSGVEAPPRP
ncbi:aldo/keto reductase [Novosphingobium sp. KCTC 2891]|uniref:aldo/keto reductase n=1 Tax=Novosphingobium sp. KCTC 2891 TaxID=2989730 RepID=UPI002222520E|nr:aldo/keto reductase [Novosphingobium sp. KCTC 2891]MCW1384947.1 aldo/keto reductase [Novosphingobium sp. KCTC 2891]